ncbi:replicative clamp [Rhodobacter phage RcHartney]|nr:replicative clamp [Rhodobacter phage RcHartney]
MNDQVQTPPDDVLAAAATAPTPAPASAAKPKRTRAKAAVAAKSKAGPNPATGLIAAIKFVALAQSKNGTVAETFCHLANQWAAASNGVLTIATRIEEDLNACPQTATFLDALGRVETDLSITQISQGFLSVASGDFRGVVPCAPFEQVPISPPDDPVAVIDDRLKQAFEAVLKVPNELSPLPHMAGVLLQSGSVVATNGAIIIEYWHGIDLPPNMLVPKVALQAVLKSGKPLVRFGFSPTSVTFWFEDQSFIKSQTFAGQFPAYQNVVQCDYGLMWPVPNDFFKAVAAVASFSDNAAVYFKGGQVVSNLNDETPSFYKVEGLPEGVGFDGKLLALIADKASRFLFTEQDPSGRNEIPRLFFVGENLRGVVAGLENKAPAVYRDNADDWANPGYAQEGGRYFDPDDEIPF